MIVNFDFHAVPFLLNLAHSFVSQLELVGEVVDMALEGLDLSDIVLFLLLQLLDRELTAAHVLLEVKAFLVGAVVVLRQLLDGFLVAVIFDARVSVVL